MPTTLTNRHHLIAALAATGLPHVEIASKANCTPTSVSRVLADPAVQTLVQQYREQYVSSTMTEAVARLQAETPATIERVLYWRDCADASASLRAANMILQRTIPVQTKHTEDRTVRIIMESAEREYHKTVLLEAEVPGLIEAHAQPLEDLDDLDDLEDLTPADTPALDYH